MTVNVQLFTKGPPRCPCDATPAACAELALLGLAAQFQRVRLALIIGAAPPAGTGTNQVIKTLHLLENAQEATKLYRSTKHAKKNKARQYTYKQGDPMHWRRRAYSSPFSACSCRPRSTKSLFCCLLSTAEQPMKSTATKCRVTGCPSCRCSRPEIFMSRG